MTLKRRAAEALKKEWLNYINEPINDSIWKQIPIFDGYRIAKCGCILSETRRYLGPQGKEFVTVPKILKPTPNNKGYLTATLRRDNKSFDITIHRTAAQTWIPNPDNLSEVNHKIPIKSHNHISNLEWSSMLQNKAHALSNKLYQSGGRHYKAKPIINLETGIFYDFIAEAAFSIGMERGKLNDRLSGKTPNKTSLMFA